MTTEDREAIGANGALPAKKRAEMKNYIERIEKLEESKRETAAEIGGVYKSAKDAGFDTKAMRQVIKLKKMDKENREVFEHTVDVYKMALGMLADLPLGQAVIKKAAEAAQPHA